MSAQQYRNEKKFIEEAVGKVREVVHTASKNDIILALHNFDFDVNKTIQAFCDDGAQSALDSWERSGSGGNKKKNQKKKKAKDHASSGAATASATPSANSARSSTPQAMNGVIVPPVVNGIAKVTTKPPNRPETGPLPTPESGQGVMVTDVDSTPKVPSVSSISFKTTTTTGTLDDVQSFDTGHIGEDAAGLKDHSRQIEKIEAIFENEISVAEENVRNSFKCIRQILGERESHLLAELRRTHDEGARFFNERRVLSCELDERANRMSAMSDREQAELRDEIARFVAEKQAEEEIARATRFHCDNAQLIKLVKNFGEVVAVKGIARGATTSVAAAAAAAVARQAPATVSTYTIKHSTSHSSIVSSLGEDSGLGQISPVGNEDRKNVAEVSNGGILMKSDALTAEQLADLNKKLQESLKAQGIDASILSGIGNRNAMPARRRPPGGGGRGGGQGNWGRGGGRGAPRGGGGNRTSLVHVPNLSILQS